MENSIYLLPVFVIIVDIIIEYRKVILAERGYQAPEKHCYLGGCAICIGVLKFLTVNQYLIKISVFFSISAA